ncbi:MAG TPA: hypothetical protein VK689_20985 [Armatimonadota bacterium]|nr:hypothetical protein [Armatimonadota bacterium]
MLAIALIALLLAAGIPAYQKVSAFSAAQGRDFGFREHAIALAVTAFTVIAGICLMGWGVGLVVWVLDRLERWRNQRKGHE